MLLLALTYLWYEYDGQIPSRAAYERQDVEMYVA